MDKIPKKIHWCWLSGDPLPKKIQKCVDSWKRVMPDYEIILWDANRFDVHSAKFVEDACNARKWAFAADYIRLYALYIEGGIYLDSDVLVFKRFDKFLQHAAFSAIEYHEGKNFWAENGLNPKGYNAIQAAVIGAEKGNPWIKMCLEHYQNEKIFRRKENNAVDVEIIPDAIARYLYQYYGFRPDQSPNVTQYLKEEVVIYSQNVFATAYTGVNSKTCALHMCEGGWYDDKVLRKRKNETLLKKLDRYLCTRYRFFAGLHYKRKQLLQWVKSTRS